MAEDLAGANSDGAVANFLLLVVLVVFRCCGVMTHSADFRFASTAQWDPLTLAFASARM